MLNNKAGQKPSTLKPLITELVSKTMSALITKVKRPRVIMFTGKVKTIKTGLITAFTNPKKKAVQSALQKLKT